jgi:large subunit ribosomal protein L30
MSFDNILNKKITLVQIKSDNKLIKRQKATLCGLGLRGVNTQSELMASKDVIGMVKKVSHLIKVSDI